MPGHVNEVTAELASQGIQVEAFNDVYQSGKSFTIDGSPYTWEDIKLDFSNSNNQYLTNSNGYISEVDLPNTLMYKANQQWVQKLIDDGYEIIDIGYPVGENLDPSLFYTMELNLIFP